MKKKIDIVQRRHQDYLRRKGLKVGRVYEGRLMRLRAKEVKRVLELCKNFDNPHEWAGVVEGNLSEPYLFDWYKGLYTEAGLPMMKSTARDLSKGKAEPNDDMWLEELMDYAEQRAGQEIVLVSGTMKENLVKVVRGTLEEHPDIGVEKFAQSIFKGYKDIALWQARRIAQTETMIGLAAASDMAAQTLSVNFLKQWCISGVGNTRESHEVMDGVIVGQNERFVLKDCEMNYPHEVGAPAGEIINCACTCIRLPMI